jgi:hypothetical protein
MFLLLLYDYSAGYMLLLMVADSGEAQVTNTLFTRFHVQWAFPRDRPRPFKGGPISSHVGWFAFVLSRTSQ